MSIYFSDGKNYRDELDMLLNVPESLPRIKQPAMNLEQQKEYFWKQYEELKKRMFELERQINPPVDVDPPRSPANRIAQVQTNATTISDAIDENFAMVDKGVGQKNQVAGQPLRDNLQQPLQREFLSTEGEGEEKKPGRVPEDFMENMKQASLLIPVRTLIKELVRGKGLDNYLAATRKAVKNLPKVLEAERLERLGKTAKEIYKNTKIFRGLDNEWKTEIPTFNMRIDDLKEGPLEEVIHFPELFEYYPEFRNIKIELVKPSEAFKKPYGSFSARSNKITLNPTRIEKDNRKGGLRGVLVHELQHVVQAIEDYHYIYRGSNVDDLKKMARTRLEALASAEDVSDKLKAAINKFIQKIDVIAGKLYYKNPGEVEARIAQFLSMLPENVREAYDTTPLDVISAGRRVDSLNRPLRRAFPDFYVERLLKQNVEKILKEGSESATPEQILSPDVKPTDISGSSRSG